MPHIPHQRFSGSAGISPELTSTPRRPFRATKPPVPYHGSSPGEQAPDLEAQKTMVPKVSMKDFAVPVDRVFTHLFGKEAVRHEFTRELKEKKQ